MITERKRYDAPTIMFYGNLGTSSLHLSVGAIKRAPTTSYFFRYKGTLTKMEYIPKVLTELSLIGWL
jgi:hypothetical protein